nr:adenylosuccinate lyase family protein [Acinetobacter oleivorans]
MSTTVFDSILFKNMFNTPEMANIFSDKSLIEKYIETEVALAKAEAACSVIPTEAAEQIAKEATFDKLDLTEMQHQTEIVGYPILPLVEQLSKKCGDAGRYLHWGATTQDIMDTAVVLQIRDALQIVERDVADLRKILKELSITYRDTPMAGRTHLQHALPITFGYKCAIWLAMFDRHAQRLTELKPRVLVGEFAGAAGTLASLGDKGFDVQKEMMKVLDLGVPQTTWHGEAFEPFVKGRGASSTMPQKRNPISCELIYACAKGVRQHAGLMLDAMIQDFERSTGPWQAEWIAIPESFALTGSALAQAKFMLAGLEVIPERMSKNLNMTNGLIVAEAVMMGLAPYLGRQTAHDVVYDACRDSFKENITLHESLMKNSTVTEKLSEEQLRKLTTPENYIGLAPQMVDRAIQMSGTK